MIVDDLVRGPGAWLSVRRSTGIVISSRVRLARNLAGHRFPARADDNDRVAVSRLVRDAFERSHEGSRVLFFDLSSLDPVDRAVLHERHLISGEHVEERVGAGLIVTPGERVAVMINEEDHLRIQAMSPGMSLPKVWRSANSTDAALERHLAYAFSPDLGYLTSCPSNLGTGLRVSVMLHLSGMKLTNEVDAVINGLDKLGLMVRGLMGEGTEAFGNMFQISNQSSLGESEPEIIDQLSDTVDEVVQHELNARARLLEGRRTFLLDQIWRAYGILRHARTLSSCESIDLLSGLRLGAELGLVRNLTVAQINDIMLTTQPGHLQRSADREVDPEQRDILRASIIRHRLQTVTVRE